MITPGQRKSYLQQSLPELKDYLLSNAAIWPLGSQPYPLTIGNILLELQFFTIDQADLADQIKKTVEQTKQYWRVRWSEKAGIEARSRLTNWAEVTSNSESMTDATYQADIRNRLILQLLLSEQNGTVTANSVALADQKILKHLAPGGPILPEKYQALFDGQDYWFLHKSVRR